LIYKGLFLLEKVDNQDILLYTVSILNKKEDVKMAQFKLYQIHLTDAEIDLINAEGHDAVHKQSLKLDMNLRKNDTGMVASDAFNRGYYTHVSNITADDLNGVFHTGNMGPEENIERLAPMYSCSVGDIIEDEAGNKQVVANFGFAEVA
tara:strand:- start:119 stop:565 length:447 start_codon:yes stop_codon:yes gene_type:complete